MPHGIQQAALKCNYVYRHIILSHFVLLTNTQGSCQRSVDGTLLSEAYASLQPKKEKKKLDQCGCVYHETLNQKDIQIFLFHNHET